LAKIGFNPRTHGAATLVIERFGEGRNDVIRNAIPVSQVNPVGALRGFLRRETGSGTSGKSRRRFARAPEDIAQPPVTIIAPFDEGGSQINYLEHEPERRSRICFRQRSFDRFA